MLTRILICGVVLLGTTSCEVKPTPPAARHVVVNPFAFPAALPGSETAQGSGCKVSGTQLPDGVWFGYVNEWDKDGLSMDVACYYWGEAANAQAALKHDEMPPNLFYVVNDQKSLTRVRVAEGAVAYRIIQVPEAVRPEKTTYIDMLSNQGGYMRCPSTTQECTVWVYINNGVATEVQMQYFP